MPSMFVRMKSFGPTMLRSTWLSAAKCTTRSGVWRSNSPCTAVASAMSGLTLRTVHEFCGERVGEVRTAVLYEKSRSVVTCDYVWRRTDSWIVFPWSKDPPVGSVATTEA